MSISKVSSSSASEDKKHPVALASHEDVVKDNTLFMNTLKSFNSAVGSKFTIPVIGAKELDLHVLYIEVTKRGGYDKVVTEKKWREVGTVFAFSATTTSASYALRKHYFNLLYRYELIYYFRFKDFMTAPQNAGNKFANIVSEERPSFDAIGTIDGKINCGYLISVKLGDETLNGVLYHPRHPGSPASAAPQAWALGTPHIRKPGGRRSHKRRGGDPGRPKPNRSGYNFFFAEKHAALKLIHPLHEREFTRMIGEAWNKLSHVDKMVYQEYGVRDKERYQRELTAYKERLKMGGNVATSQAENETIDTSMATGTQPVAGDK